MAGNPRVLRLGLAEVWRKAGYHDWFAFQKSAQWQAERVQFSKKTEGHGSPHSSLHLAPPLKTAEENAQPSSLYPWVRPAGPAGPRGEAIWDCGRPFSATALLPRQIHRGVFYALWADSCFHAHLALNPECCLLRLSRTNTSRSLQTSSKSTAAEPLHPSLSPSLGQPSNHPQPRTVVLH